MNVPVRWWSRPAARLAVADLALGVLLAAIAVASVIAGKPPEGPLRVTLPAALAMTVPLVWRSRWPLLVTTTVMVAAEVQTLLTIAPGSLWAFAAFLICVYTVAFARPEGPAALGGAIVVGGLWLQEWHERGTDYLFIILVFGGTWLLGRAVRRWRSRAETAEAEQDDKARLAVAEERLRIAWELHDIVAHGLGVIVVQANAAEAALDHDPALARAPVAAVKHIAGNALDDMRQLLGLLRGVDDVAPRQPQPGLARLDVLLADFRRAGLQVEHRVTGYTGDLPPVVDVVAYRIVQEGLTNALKHAGPVPTTVTLAGAHGRLTIDIHNERGAAPTASAGTGNGLTGLRERAAAVGGEILVGPTDSGGFRVYASLPTAMGAQ